MDEQSNTGAARVPDRKEPERLVLDDVTFQRVSREIKNPAPPTAALVALFKLDK